MSDSAVAAAAEATTGEQISKKLVRFVRSFLSELLEIDDRFA